MSDTCPTVRVKHKDGHIVINEADFDPAIHERAELPPPPAPADPAAEKPAA